MKKELVKEIVISDIPTFSYEIFRKDGNGSFCYDNVVLLIDYQHLKKNRKIQTLIYDFELNSFFCSKDNDITCHLICAAKTNVKHSYIELKNKMKEEKF